MARAPYGEFEKMREERDEARRERDKWMSEATKASLDVIALTDELARLTRLGDAMYRHDGFAWAAWRDRDKGQT